MTINEIYTRSIQVGSNNIMLSHLYFLPLYYFLYSIRTLLKSLKKPAENTQKQRVGNVDIELVIDYIYKQIIQSLEQKDNLPYGDYDHMSGEEFEFFLR